MQRRFITRVSVPALIFCAMSVLCGSAFAAKESRAVQRVYGMVLAINRPAQCLTLQAKPTDVATTYRVENKKQFRRVKTGDQILGRVYEGETELRNVEIVGIAARRPVGAGAAGN